MLRIREARLADLRGITDIYNDAIRTTTATFDVAPKTMDEQRTWFEGHSSNYPILVAEDAGSIVGWASLSPWSDRCAYSDTAEISVYVAQGSRGKGIGKQLVKAILRSGKNAGLHTVIARVAEGNAVSVRMFEDAGFEHIGVMREVGKKFSKLIDVYLMQKIYDSPSSG